MVRVGATVTYLSLCRRWVGMCWWSRHTAGDELTLKWDGLISARPVVVEASSF